ncbi:MAG TPA: stalk domain-containing protein [Caldisericia bacterium]|nr:stalk domain-containing protein [Caldisericia bacterium]
MGRSFRQFISVLLSTILLVGLFLFSSPDSSYAIKDHWMEVVPRKVATGATYKFHFTIEKKLEVHDYIKLWWPVESTFPVIPEDPAARNKELTRIIESMSIGLSPCSACQGLPIIVDTKTEKSIQFNSHIALDPAIEGYRDITITVPDVVGIKNPEKPGNYIYKIANKVEPTPVPSTPVAIVESKIGVPTGIPVVEVTPPSFRSLASYKISFNVGEGGWLKQGEALLRLKFPEGTTFSRNVIAENAILVNGTPLSVRPSPRGLNLIFNTPVEIADSGRVEILISERAGIINPAKPGSYRIEVSTMPADQDWVASEPYDIVKGGAVLKVNPAKVNKTAEYSFAFILDENESLKKADRIQVLFPENAKMPSNSLPAAILINDVPVTNVTFNKTEATIYSGVELKAGDTCEIRFNAEAGIMNPPTPGEIKLGYKFASAKDYLYTLPVVLTEAKLEAGEVTVEPRNASSVGEWLIKASLGDNGALTSNDYIGIEFPASSKVPSSIPAKAILVNGEEVDKVESKGNVIHFYPASTLPGGEDLTINIKREAKIENPSEVKADYYLSIFTSKETEPVKSDTFNINDPLPRTEVQITGGKKGRNDWYLEPPMVGFTCSSPNAEIFVYWDENDEQTIKYDGSAKVLDLGQYVSKLNFYARDVFGTEEIRTVEIKVDTVLPEMVIEVPTEARTISTTNKAVIAGRTTLIKTIRYGVDVLEYDKLVYINDKKVPVADKDGAFELEVELEQGENKFVIRAEDEGGNTLTREYVIFFDNIAPEVEIISPTPGSVVTSSRTTVKGKTEADAQLTINGEIVYIESDGSFEHDIRLSKVGKAKLEIEAVDPAGNSMEKVVEFWFGYTIILQIGNKKGSTNGVEKTLDVPPFITGGRTLVPFRFIGEQLNAKIDFTQNPATKLVQDVIYELGSTKIVLTIGKKEASVNGKATPMDVPAQIVSGRTVVPIRFVTENLGCEIAWEGKEQIITITYPKP